MKKNIIVAIVIIASLFAFSACGNDSTSSNENLTKTPNYKIVYEEQFDIFNPYAEALSDDLLVQIKADGFTGDDLEIAQQILNWQKNNMYYTTDTSTQQDVSYQGRWNMFMPGIYPASELVQEHVTSDSKIYGICFDYALW